MFKEILENNGYEISLVDHSIIGYFQINIGLNGKWYYSNRFHPNDHKILTNKELFIEEIKETACEESIKENGFNLSWLIKYFEEQGFIFSEIYRNHRLDFSDKNDKLWATVLHFDLTDDFKLDNLGDKSHYDDKLIAYMFAKGIKINNDLEVK